MLGLTGTLYVAQPGGQLAVLAEFNQDSLDARGYVPAFQLQITRQARERVVQSYMRQNQHSLKFVLDPRKYGNEQRLPGYVAQRNRAGQIRSLPSVTPHDRPPWQIRRCLHCVVISAPSSEGLC